MASDEVFHIIRTTRAMRRLKPDPVPDELINRILEAGVCAASGANQQQWQFLVVKDGSIKQQIQHYYERAFNEIVVPLYRASGPPLGVTQEEYDRQLRAVAYLTEHFHEAPVWIVACIDHGEQQPGPASGASIYPAVQNMLLAARALGLGSDAHHAAPCVQGRCRGHSRLTAERSFVCHPPDRLPFGKLRSRPQASTCRGRARRPLGRALLWPWDSVGGSVAQPPRFQRLRSCTLIQIGAGNA